MACRLTAEAARRFPEHAEIRKANRILNEWNVTSSPQVEPSTSEEIEWVKNPPVDVHGKWVALIGSQLVGIADTATELMELIRSRNLPQKPLVHHFAS
ncbi:MAG: hypothetical protein GY856_02785 [bacterium]|nr:hypothetical protein [bacterium]